MIQLDSVWKARNLRLPFILLMLFMLSSSQSLLAQKDTLVTKSNEQLTGKIKVFDEGVLKIETAYSDQDFAVEFEKIVYIHTINNFLILTTDGDRYYGTVKSQDRDSLTAIITEKSGTEVEVNLNDLVYMKEVEDDFWERLDLELSIGYTLTKANNNEQFSGNIRLGYFSSKSSYDLYFSLIRAFQENENFETRISRTNGGFSYARFIVRDWFMLLNSDLLESSEQQLDLRSNTKGGIGYYLVKNSKMNLGLVGGVAWVYESYSDVSETLRNSAEAFIAAEYKIFDLGDLDLATKCFAYPSLTESGRFRTDFNIGVKYEFPLDFFIKVDYTLNYDNQPPAGVPNSDYVFQTTFGWEL